MRAFSLIFLLSFSPLLFAAVRTPVAIVVGGSPCTGGPTNCNALVRHGQILITSPGGHTTSLRVSSSGMTHLSLTPGRYRFQYKVTSPVGSSEVVEQDIAINGFPENLVSIQTDTGIR